jgi:5-methylthioadenosine/S-adenosylhomocysteine deaminase
MRPVILASLFLLLAGPATATVTVTVGTATNSYVLSGQIVTPDQVVDGNVVVVGDTITCVGDTCTEPAGATLIRVSNAYIVPGLIDAHNHVAYNVFPKWVPPKLYSNRYQWQGSASYKAFKAPYNDLKASVYCEMVKYGEIKALVSGITTIQGTSPNRSCFKTLVRNVENQNELGLPANHIRTNILAIGDFGGSVDWNVTKSFVVHVGEGIDEKSRAEFDALKQKGLLNANTAVIHGTGFGAAEFAEMATVGAKLIWSPQSNLVLYGKTTDIKAARQAGVKISLGVDWNPSGSDSIFDELRVADSANREEFDEAIPEGDWLKMVTVNPAEALAVGDRIGRLAVGFKADLLVLQRRDDDPNRSLLKNEVQDVQWVMIGGEPLYGNEAGIQKVRPDQCEALTVHGSKKRVCIRESPATVEKSNQSLADIRQMLLTRYSGLAPLAP